MIIQAIGKDTRGLGNNRQRFMRWFHWQEEKKQSTNTAIFIALLTILFIFINGNAVVLGQKVQPPEKIEFSPGSELPLEPRSFCVTDDQVFIIPDYQAGNIKLYEINEGALEWINTIGHKGYGPDELSKPTVCFWNKDENKFVVLDLGIRKIFIYDRIGRIEFQRVKEIPCWRGAFDIKLIGDRLFISGYASGPNKMHYDFYYIDLMTDQTTYLLPSHLKYDLESSREFEKQFLEKYEIPSIGVKSKFDIHKDDAYYIWEGNLKVIKINIASGYIEPKLFGMQPPHYIKPHAAAKLIEGFHKNDSNIIRSERAKSSYVRNISVNSKYVYVIYEGPDDPENGSKFWLQSYTLDGDFIKEKPIPGKSDWLMYFSNDGNILYYLTREFIDEVGQTSILKYQNYE